MSRRIIAMITGTGHAVPEKVLTNHDLAEMVDTSDEWIRTRTGIVERHIANDNEGTSDYAARAAKEALKEANLAPEDMDLILFGTVTPDMYFPSAACFLQEKIGAVNAAAMDISAACSGFLYGLTLAEGMIASGKYKNILVIGAELLSKITDWTDRATCVLFGDGAGAAVVQPSDGEKGIIGSYIKSDGRLWHLLNMPGGGSLLPPAQAKDDTSAYYIKMEGREVFRHAVTLMGEAAGRVLKEAGFTGEDLDLFIPHQANLRIIQAIAKRLNIPDEKVYVNLDKYGNTSAASIPIALNEARRNGRIKPGSVILGVAFGAGFTWSAVLFRI